ncbi:MAG: nucleoside-diphosphate kinase [Candidatus Babeliales bacterium]|jgi:nucleoside-diphosphate kinase
MMRKKLIFVILGSLSLAAVLYLAYKKFSLTMRSNKIERTLAIIKPDAVAAHLAGKIIDRIEQDGFTIVDLRKIKLEAEQAEKLYDDYRTEKFFHQLVDHMTSGPIIVMILEKLNAIPDWRDIVGHYDPLQAKEGTLRKQFGVNIWQNAVQGSRNASAATREIGLFFADRTV